MDDPARRTPWFIRLAQAVVVSAFIWFALTDGLGYAVTYVLVSLAAASLVVLVLAVREAILRRYPG